MKNLLACQKVYIAGPMRGLPFYNFQKFVEIEYWLKNVYEVEVVNPVKIDIEDYGIELFVFSPNGDPEETKEFGFNFDLKKALAKDISAILLECDAIFLLDGWEKSAGAKLEKHVAEVIDIDIFYEEEFREEIERFFNKE